MRPLLYADIPAVGQRALLDAVHPFLRIHLASSPHLDRRVATELLTSADLTVRGPAAQRADDQELVSSYGSGVNSKGGDRHPGVVYRALLNPVCDAEVLALQLENIDARFSLAAALNPSTPEPQRRSKLTGKRVTEMIRTGSSSGDVAIRAAALVEANPWMVESVGAWPPIVRQSLLHLESLTPEQHQEVVSSLSRVRFAEQHPAVTGVPFADLSVRELLDLDAPAAHLATLGRADLSLGAVNAMASSRQAASRPMHWLVLARMVERFGPAVAYKANMSATRLKAAGWLVPAAHQAGLFGPAQTHEAERAASILGSDPLAWDTFARLSSGSVLTLEELAAASVALAGPSLPAASAPSSEAVRAVRVASPRRPSGRAQVL